MIKRKYAYIKIDNDNINFEDVENTITYSLSAKNLENNLNKREEELCNKIAELEAKLAESEFAHNSYFEKAEETISFLQQQFNEKGKIEEQLEELKQRLAEKEKEIERIKTNYVGGMQNANEATRIFK